MFQKDPNLLSSFGCDPYARFWTDVHDEHAITIKDVVGGHQLCAVIGEYGVGKSVLVRETLRDIDQPIYIKTSSRRSLRVGHILSGIVYELDKGNPRRDIVARQYQVERYLGELIVRSGNQIAIVIDNAHRMHHRTLLEIKDLMETMEYGGVCPLVSFILIGHPQLESTLKAHREVYHRTRSIHLDEAHGWMTQRHRIEYLKTVYGDAIAPDVRKRLAAVHTSMLRLDHQIDEHLRTMMAAGVDRMTWQHAPLPMRDVREAAGLSLSQLAKMSGVPNSTISDIEHNKTESQEAEDALWDSLDTFLDDSADSKAA